MRSSSREASHEQTSTHLVLSCSLLSLSPHSKKRFFEKTSKRKERVSGDGEPAMAHIHHQSGEQLAQRGGGDGVARPPPCSIPYFFLSHPSFLDTRCWPFVVSWKKRGRPTLTKCPLHLSSLPSTHSFTHNHFPLLATQENHQHSSFHFPYCSSVHPSRNQER